MVNEFEQNVSYETLYTNEFPDCHLVLKYFLDIKYIKTFFTPPNTVALIRIQNFCWLWPKNVVTQSFQSLYDFISILATYDNRRGSYGGRRNDYEVVDDDNDYDNYDRRPSGGRRNFDNNRSNDRRGHIRRSIFDDTFDK